MSPIWNRRMFLSSLALSAAASRSLFASARPDASPYLAFVGVASTDQPHLDHIEAYRVEEGRWSRMNSAAPAIKPRALALHPRLPVLYAAHCKVMHGNLPRGSVSAFTFGPSTGNLAQVNEQPLALSATHPDHLAVSPDGRTLMVAASTGGAWNFFTLAADGAILPTPSTLKLTGSGPHARQGGARPHSIVCHPASLVAYATDFGSDRIDAINLAAEMSQGGGYTAAPSLTTRHVLSPGSGPADLVLHSSGEFLVAVSQLKPSLSVFSIAHNGEASVNLLQILSLDAEEAGALACNPRGDRLYLATRQRSGEIKLTVFEWSAATGRIHDVQRARLPGHSLPNQIVASSHDLLVLGREGVHAVALHPSDGSLVAPARSVLDSPHAVSLAIYPITV